MSYSEALAILKIAQTLVESQPVKCNLFNENQNKED